jgi:TniQ
VQKNISSVKLWPVHLKPKPDELLTSWLVRLAMAHAQKLHTFCSIAWPEKPIWNRDIDKAADVEIIQVLSTKTGTPRERVRTTTLAAYEGVLYEKHNRFGPTPWVMPVGVFHRTRKQYGLQYCPHCLSEDGEPYYRRRWRLAFVVLCNEHNRLLRDRCPTCQAPINFHRNELGNHKKRVTVSLVHCYACDFDLRQAPVIDKDSTPISPTEVKFTATLLKAISDGYVIVNNGITVYSHLYFTGLRQLMKIMAMKDARVNNLRQELSNTYGVELFIPRNGKRPPDTQEQSLSERRQLIQLISCLLTDWPSRFIMHSRKHNLWSSVWLRHIESGPWERSRTSPFWFWSVVHEHLYRSKYSPSEQEIKLAIEHLKSKGDGVNKSTLARLLGISVIRNNRTI